MSYSAQDVAAAVRDVLSQGATPSDIAQLAASKYGIDSDSLKNVTTLYGIPGFAGGGYHSGGIRVVGEHGPEIEVTGPSYIANASDTSRLLRSINNNSSNNASEEMVRALKKMGDRLALIEGYTSATAAHTAATARRLVRLEKAAEMSQT